MKIGEQIKNYRKDAGLTQEQVANYLGVSAPAVNKWERGNTYPDITLLLALARLLQIDMNQLFSFREELTELEIAQFTEKLSELAMEGNVSAAFEMTEKKIQEYPHCDLLIYMSATILNSALSLSATDETQKEEYNRQVISWLERAADSSEEKVRMSAVYMLAAKYSQMKEYQKAGLLLDKIPDLTVDTAVLRAEILARQEGEVAAITFLEGNLLQTATRIQNYLYKLIELEEQAGNRQKADEIAQIAEKLIPLMGLWNYGTVVPRLILAVSREDAEQSVELIRTVLKEAQKHWHMEESPLYHRIPAKKPAEDIGSKFVQAIITEIENAEGYDFLKGNEELERVLAEYREG